MENQLGALERKIDALLASVDDAASEPETSGLGGGGGGGAGGEGNTGVGRRGGGE